MFRRNRDQRKNILVRNGVDVKKQMLCSGKGEYFAANLNNYGTELIQEDSNYVWRISFTDLKSGEQKRYRFRKKIWIGRALPSEDGEERMVLRKDLKVSKTHCVVYEYEGKLCLADYHSKNHTYVNGKKLEAPVFLRNGDVLKIGDGRYRLEYGR